MNIGIADLSGSRWKASDHYKKHKKTFKQPSKTAPTRTSNKPCHFLSNLANCQGACWVEIQTTWSLLVAHCGLSAVMSEKTCAGSSRYHSRSNSVPMFMQLHDARLLSSSLEVSGRSSDVFSLCQSWGWSVNKSDRIYIYSCICLYIHIYIYPGRRGTPCRDPA